MKKAKITEVLTEKQRVFLEHYVDSYNITDACRKAKISRPSVYNWKRDNKEFEAAMESIDENYVDLSQGVINHTLKYGYKTDKSGVLIQVPTGKKTNIPQKNEKDEIIVDEHGEVVYEDELTHVYSREAIDAAKFVLMKYKKGKDRGYADTLDINADIKAMQTKILSKDEIIDVSAEEMKQMFLEDIKNG